MAPPRYGFFTLVALLALGCDPAGAEQRRSEPWLKDEVALQRTERQLVRYTASPGQVLHFSVRAQRGSVRGQVPLASAVIELDPEALDLTRGSLKFDLERLSLERTLEKGGEGAAPTGDLLLAEAARLWLSLGPDVPKNERALAESAHLGIRLGRGLSSHSVQGGLSVPTTDERGRRSLVHRVSGIAEGDLLLLGRAVTHVLKAEVDFAERPAGSAAPERFVVRLSQPEAVPLAEHRIAPRDARGAVVTEQVVALGRSSSLRALVSGELRFERSRD